MCLWLDIIFSSEKLFETFCPVSSFWKNTQEMKGPEYSASKYNLPIWSLGIFKLKSIFEWLLNNLVKLWAPYSLYVPSFFAQWIQGKNTQNKSKLLTYLSFSYKLVFPRVLWSTGNHLLQPHKTGRLLATRFATESPPERVMSLRPW